MTEQDYLALVAICEDIEARPVHESGQLYFDFFLEEGDADPVLTVTFNGPDAQNILVTVGETEIDSLDVADAALKKIQAMRPDTFFIAERLFESDWSLSFAPDLRRLMDQTPAEFADWQDELPLDMHEDARDAYIYLGREYRTRLRRSRRT